MNESSNQTLRILFISRAFPPIIGGIEKQNYEINKHLSKRAKVKLIANRRGKLFLPLFLPYAITYALWQARRYDLVLLGDGVLAIVAWALSRMRYRPFVFCILHGLDLTFSSVFYQKLWVGLFLPTADVLLPVSQQTLTEVTNRGLCAAHCRVIANGVDPDEFNKKFYYNDLQRLLRCNIKNKITLLTTGRLVERKGIHWFVDSVLPRLPEDIVYVIAGDGPMRKRIEENISRLGLDSRVFLLGRVTNEALHALYATADIFVQPNIPVKNDMEGFGLVVLEAGAAGLPVVASRLEGLTDAISEGDNGQLVTPGCVDEYVKHINVLAGDAAARKERGQRARAYICRHFTWQVVADRYINVFKEYLGTRKNLSAYEKNTCRI